MAPYVIFIIALVAGAVIFLVIYLSLFSGKAEPEIITEPKISQLRAIEIVTNDLKVRYPSFDGSTLTIFVSSQGQVPIDKFQESGSQLELGYYHPNGTQFSINSTTHSIKNSCPPRICTFDFYGTAVGKLVYVLEVDCRECGFHIYAVDAVGGAIIYTSKDGTSQNQIGEIPPP